jgi:hypothetical protein
MRITFLILMLGHGVIHVLGFVKAFELSNVKELTLSISKPLGAMWLVGFVMFAIAAVLFAVRNDYWWFFGLIAVVISQGLIFYAWHDAKFGTLANVFILLVAIVGYGEWHFHRQYRHEVNSGLQATASLPNSMLTEADMEFLPESVKKYIRQSGAIGKPKVKSFKAQFNGQFKMKKDADWMPFRSEQYNFLNTASRQFFMTLTMNYLPVAGFHSFINGNAFMDIRLLSLFRVEYQSGKDMGIGETVTFFNDMCVMAPATLIDPRITWFDAEGKSVKATFENNNIAISAKLTFNDDGELINFVSNDRYAVSENHTTEKIPWSTPMKDYKEINGFNLPGYAEVIYNYPAGDFCYGIFRLTAIQYNAEE